MPCELRGCVYGPGWGSHAFDPHSHVVFEGGRDRHQRKHQREKEREAVVVVVVVARTSSSEGELCPVSPVLPVRRVCVPPRRATTSHSQQSIGTNSPQYINKHMPDPEHPRRCGHHCSSGSACWPSCWLRRLRLQVLLRMQLPRCHLPRAGRMAMVRVEAG